MLEGIRLSVIIVSRYLYEFQHSSVLVSVSAIISHPILFCAATLVKKLALSEADMKELAKKLKQVCGSGGTIKADMIEI